MGFRPTSTSSDTGDTVRIRYGTVQQVILGTVRYGVSTKDTRTVSKTPYPRVCIHKIIRAWHGSDIA